MNPSHLTIKWIVSLDFRYIFMENASLLAALFDLLMRQNQYTLWTLSGTGIYPLHPLGANSSCFIEEQRHAKHTVMAPFLKLHWY